MLEHPALGCTFFPRWLQLGLVRGESFEGLVGKTLWRMIVWKWAMCRRNLPKGFPCLTSCWKECSCIRWSQLLNCWNVGIISWNSEVKILVGCTTASLVVYRYYHMMLGVFGKLQTLFWKMCEPFGCNYLHPWTLNTESPVFLSKWWISNCKYII